MRNTTSYLVFEKDFATELSIIQSLVGNDI